MISKIIFGLSIFFNAIILHELGHFFYFKWILKRNVVIRFFHFKRYHLRCGTEDNYLYLDNKYKINLYLAGIIAGFIPLWIAFISNVFYGIFLIPYFLGCRKDLMNIWRLRK